MTYNGIVVARIVNRPYSMLFSSPDACAKGLNIILTDGKTLGQLLDLGHSRFETMYHCGIVKIRKVRDCRRAKE